jgi:RNA polymerase sigma factor (sigma-70 family)
MGINAATINHNEAITFFNSEKPWLDQNNKPLSDDLLKIVSKSWSSETWEKYLNWCETPLREAQIHHTAYEDMADKMNKSIFEEMSYESSESKKLLIKQLLKKLTLKQKKVIELVYWQGKTERDISICLGISRSSVRDLKFRALSKMQ